ncbi:hypothetical protein SASPL_104939 [Salvia splendens]|uniref:Chitin-binding type-1 domain-containing protein n=1 Tax=Salvia splendens TaxID=180675 RepID=A0A8X8YKD8_SALSN|nr:hypothetical protein SASPL_104939 [Salvia splendens]
MKPSLTLFTVLALLPATGKSVSGQNCGCAPTLCCSQHGYCGTTNDYCGPGCRSGPCFGSGNKVNLCYAKEINQANRYCDSNNRQWPCATGQSYFGRGPIQLSWNYNYGPAGRAVGFDGLNNPDIVARNNIISLKTTLWVWMNNVHAIITSGQGFGPTIRAINSIECNGANPATVIARVNYYTSYCSLLVLLS